MKYLFPTLSICLATALTGCGGGGTPGSVLPSDPADRFLSLAETFGFDQEEINGRGATEADLGQSASMTGAIAVIGETDDEIAGNVDLDFDFDAGTISGSASGFGIYQADDIESCTEVSCPFSRTSDIAGELAVTGTVQNVNDVNLNAAGALSGTSDALGAFTTDVDVDLIGELGVIDGNLATYAEGSDTLTYETIEGQVNEDIDILLLAIE